MSWSAAAVEFAHAATSASPAVFFIMIKSRKPTANYNVLLAVAWILMGVAHVEQALVTALEGSRHFTQGVRDVSEMWQFALSLSSAVIVGAAIAMMNQPSLEIKTVVSRLSDYSWAIIATAALTPRALVESVDAVLSTVAVVALAFTAAKCAWTVRPIAASVTLLLGGVFALEQAAWPFLSGDSAFKEIVALTSPLFGCAVALCDLESSPTEPPSIHGAVVTV